MWRRARLDGRRADSRRRTRQGPNGGESHFRQSAESGLPTGSPDPNIHLKLGVLLKLWLLF